MNHEEIRRQLLIAQGHALVLGLDATAAAIRSALVQLASEAVP